MYKLFISDLHLDSSHPEIAELFIKFLESDLTKSADALYILGDFFEAWIGDDDYSLFNVAIINALQKKTHEGLPIYIMHGNRDFLIGKSFCRATGCRWLPEEYVLDLYGKPVLLMHGDTLCIDDPKYLKFRRRARNKFFQKIFLLGSVQTRREIATYFRSKSKKYVTTAPQSILDVTQSEVERIMQKHQVQHLIHGHTHRPDVHQFQLNNQPATRTVLAAWDECGSVLVCDKNGGQERIILENK